MSDPTTEELRVVRLEAFARCALEAALDPERTRMSFLHLGLAPVEVSRDLVALQLGDEVASAWDQVKAAREGFHEAMRRMMEDRMASPAPTAAP
ncbi:hypothetical protein LAZ40_00940 [Cereibacter sphaeroides]|uniref:hypothetical protein n=1 Tax=Cereibacter sphaeroides TaxID=1063 RepID=UPI001F2AFEF5|nr:hypothetical protein [Cereibacter sphaeroides]MCE6957636.1 hypothetical protein [Cereibacter sphaeroides]MCE6971228.1 hypothetical protein [Cereibacter sphaeroides]